MVLAQSAVVQQTALSGQLAACKSTGCHAQHCVPASWCAVLKSAALEMPRLSACTVHTYALVSMHSAPDCGVWPCGGVWHRCSFLHPKVQRCICTAIRDGRHVVAHAHQVAHCSCSLYETFWADVWRERLERPAATRPFLSQPAATIHSEPPNSMSCVARWCTRAYHYAHSASTACNKHANGDVRAHATNCSCTIQQTVLLYHLRLESRRLSRDAQ